MLGFAMGYLECGKIYLSMFCAEMRKYLNVS